jgi:pimeloyl-ACP methyl ester carboxylesterase
MRGQFSALPGEDFWADATIVGGRAATVRVPATGFADFLAAIQSDSLVVSIQVEEFTPDTTSPPSSAADSPLLGQAMTQAASPGCNDYPLDHAAGSRMPASGDVAIVLIHGWLRRVTGCASFVLRHLSSELPGEDYFGTILPPMKTEFQAEMPIFVFTYPSHRHFNSTGTMLASRLEAAAANHGLAGFVLVGHSMGGLVARSAVESTASL